MKKLPLVMVGFLLGVVWVVACEVSVPSGRAQETPAPSTSVVRAADVTFDNAASALSATTVQAALDEIVQQAREFMQKVDVSRIVGRWELRPLYRNSDTVAGIVTFNSDGTYASENMVNAFDGICPSGQYTLVPNGILVMSACEGHSPFNCTLGFAGEKMYLGKDSRSAYEGTRL